MHLALGVGEDEGSPRLLHRVLEVRAKRGSDGDDGGFPVLGGLVIPAALEPDLPRVQVDVRLAKPSHLALAHARVERRGEHRLDVPLGGLQDGRYLLEPEEVGELPDHLAPWHGHHGVHADEEPRPRHGGELEHPVELRPHLVVRCGRDGSLVEHFVDGVRRHVAELAAAKRRPHVLVQSELQGLGAKAAAMPLPVPVHELAQRDVRRPGDGLQLELLPLDLGLDVAQQPTSIVLGTPSSPVPLLPPGIGPADDPDSVPLCEAALSHRPPPPPSCWPRPR